MKIERERSRLRFTVRSSMLVVLVIALCLFPLNLVALKRTYARRALFHTRESVRLQQRVQWESLGETPEWRELMRANMVYHSTLANKYRNAVSAPWKGVAADPTPPDEPAWRPSGAVIIPIDPDPVPSEGAYYMLDRGELVLPTPRPGSR
jgi:hypothetical protein